MTDSRFSFFLCSQQGRFPVVPNFKKRAASDEVERKASGRQRQDRKGKGEGGGGQREKVLTAFFLVRFPAATPSLIPGLSRCFCSSLYIQSFPPCLDALLLAPRRLGSFQPLSRPLPLLLCVLFPSNRVLVFSSCNAKKESGFVVGA